MKLSCSARTNNPEHVLCDFPHKKWSTRAVKGSLNQNIREREHSKTPEEKADAYTVAWNSKDPAQVAAHFTADAQIVIYRGDPHIGTAALKAMAAGFHAEFPDLHLTFDGIRKGGDHAIYQWTLKGHHAETGKLCVVGGWEERELDASLHITRSMGWFNTADYQRQIDGV